MISTTYTGKSSLKKTWEFKTVSSCDSNNRILLNPPVIHLNTPVIYLNSPVIHLNTPVKHLNSPVIHLNAPVIHFNLEWLIPTLTSHNRHLALLHILKLQFFAHATLEWRWPDLDPVLAREHVLVPGAGVRDGDLVTVPHGVLAFQVLKRLVLSLVRPHDHLLYLAQVLTAVAEGVGVTSEKTKELVLTKYPLNQYYLHPYKHCVVVDDFFHGSLSQYTFWVFYPWHCSSSSFWFLLSCPW